jgi:hypothetical protein
MVAERLTPVVTPDTRKLHKETPVRLRVSENRPPASLGPISRYSPTLLGGASLHLRPGVRSAAQRSGGIMHTNELRRLISRLEDWSNIETTIRNQFSDLPPILLGDPVHAAGEALQKSYGGSLPGEADSRWFELLYDSREGNVGDAFFEARWLIDWAKSELMKAGGTATTCQEPSADGSQRPAGKVSLEEANLRLRDVPKNPKFFSLPTAARAGLASSGHDLHVVRKPIARRGLQPRRAGHAPAAAGENAARPDHQPTPPGRSASGVRPRAGVEIAGGGAAERTNSSCVPRLRSRRRKQTAEPLRLGKSVEKGFTSTH